MSRGHFLTRAGSNGGTPGENVTDVTASNGLESSGGTTPNITPDFTGAADGDVFTFNGGSASFQPIPAPTGVVTSVTASNGLTTDGSATIPNVLPDVTGAANGSVFTYNSGTGVVSFQPPATSGTVTSVTGVRGIVSSGGNTPQLGPDVTGAPNGGVWRWNSGTSLASFQAVTTLGSVPPTPNTLLLRDTSGEGYLSLLYTDRVQSDGDGLRFVNSDDGSFDWAGTSGDIARTDTVASAGVNAFVWVAGVTAIGWSVDDKPSGTAATISMLGQRSLSGAGGPIAFVAGQGSSNGGDAVWRAGQGGVTGGNAIVRGGVGGTTNGVVRLENSAGTALIQVGTGTTQSTLATNLVYTTDNNFSIGSSTQRASNINARQLIARADTTDTLKTTFSGTGLAVTNGVNPGDYTASYQSWQELGNWRLNTVVVDDSSGLTIDFDEGNIQSIDLTGDRTIDFDNMRAGGVYTLQFNQTGIGGFAVAWPAGTVLPNGFPIILSRTPGAVDTVTGHSDGTNFIVDGFNIEDGMPYQPVELVTGTYSARGCDYIPYDPTSEAVVISLPPANTVSRNQPICLKNRTADLTSATVAADGTDTLDGAATITLDQAWQGTTLISNEVDGWDVF